MRPVRADPRRVWQAGAGRVSVLRAKQCGDCRHVARMTSVRRVLLLVEVDARATIVDSKPARRAAALASDI